MPVTRSQSRIHRDDRNTLQHPYPRASASPAPTPPPPSALAAASASVPASPALALAALPAPPILPALPAPLARPAPPTLPALTPAYPARTLRYRSQPSSPALPLPPPPPSPSAARLSMAVRANRRNEVVAAMLMLDPCNRTATDTGDAAEWVDDSLDLVRGTIFDRLTAVIADAAAKNSDLHRAILDAAPPPLQSIDSMRRNALRTFQQADAPAPHDAAAAAAVASGSSSTAAALDRAAALESYVRYVDQQVGGDPLSAYLGAGVLLAILEGVVRRPAEFLYDEAVYARLTRARADSSGEAFVVGRIRAYANDTLVSHRARMARILGLLYALDRSRFRHMERMYGMLSEKYNHLGP